MEIYIDVNSEEAFYIQLSNQIILAIATDKIRNGDSLPSVRQLADEIGINMHTVNKAYNLLKNKGLLKLDRRKGAVISIDIDKIKAINEIKKDLFRVVASCICNDINRKEIHDIIDETYDEFTL